MPDDLTSKTATEPDPPHDGASIDAIVQARVERDVTAGKLSDEAGLYVLAALDGALAEVVEDGGGKSKRRQTPPSTETPAGAYLTGASVAGFRGIGPQAHLDVTPGPGLTLVVGANGSGKSSFAEGLEFLLTGENSRWQGKTAEWRGGWRNLHAQGPTELQARFAVQGEPGDTLVVRRWREAAAANVDDTTTEGLDDLQWATALDTHRPFLSHDQLNDVVEKGPSARFDAMAAGLGLERLTDARESLRQQRLDDGGAHSAADRQRADVLSKLRELDDERAKAMHAALSNEPWDLEAVHLVLEGALDDDADQPLDLLRRLVTIWFPSAEEIEDYCSLLRDAHDSLQEAKGSNVERAVHLAMVLDAALRMHKHDGDQACPVCNKGQLDDEWRSGVVERLASLVKETEASGYGAERLSDVLSDIERFVEAPPAFLADAGRVGIDASDVLETWEWWSRSLTDTPSLPKVDQEYVDVSLPVIELGEDTIGSDEVFHARVASSDQGLLEVAGRMTERGARVRAALEPLRKQARAELERREDLWRPLRRQLLEWLPIARRGQKAAKRLPDVRAAEDWLTRVEDAVRADRFRPIQERALSFWDTMGRGSSVTLESLRLTGKGNARRLILDTSVDGQGSAALGVMSQGELNTLSLSLFLARALLPESPFRFLVVDDPVQAMDAAKVDGLARVLHDVARERQVVVFTHDERLPAAARRLRIECRVVNVGRRANSVVECRQVEDPVGQHLDNARAVLRTDDLPLDMQRRVVPGFCRQALEAACVEAVHVHRARQGCSLAQTEADVRETRTLTDKLTLLLLDDSKGDPRRMRGQLDKRFGQLAFDVVRACNAGTHEGWDGRLDLLVENTGWLAQHLLKSSPR